MQTLVFAIIGCFALIFVGSFIASILDLWIHQKNLMDYPSLRDIFRRQH
jgi:hypothetical protein